MLFSITLDIPQPLEMIRKICNFNGSLTTCEKPTLQLNSFLRDEADSIFDITLSIPRHV